MYSVICSALLPPGSEMCVYVWSGPYSECVSSNNGHLVVILLLLQYKKVVEL